MWSRRFNQNFHFSFLSTIDSTSDRVRWRCYFLPSIPTDSADLRRGQPFLFQVQENQEVPHSKPFLIYLSVPLLPLPGFFEVLRQREDAGRLARISSEVKGL